KRRRPALAEAPERFGRISEELTRRLDRYFQVYRNIVQGQAAGARKSPLSSARIGEPRMPLEEERSDLVLAIARVLYVNGQATEEIVGAAARLADILGLRAALMPRWGELQLQSEDTGGRLITQVAADPTGVDMDRVVSVMQTIERLGAGRRSHRCAGGALPAEFVAAPRRGLSVHDPGARAACAQWRDGSHQWPHPSRCRPPALCGARRCGDLGGIATRPRPSRRISAG